MNLNISQFKGSYLNKKPINSLDMLFKETEEDQGEIDRLQQRLNQQQQQVDALMKVVSNSQQQIYLSQDRYKNSVESERFNSQLLDEIKNLKKQIIQIESGPRLAQAPFIPPFLPQQQYPYSYHQPINQMPMVYPLQNQNPYYQYYPFQNMPQQQIQKEDKSFNRILKSLAKKKEEAQLNQLMLQMLKNQQDDSENEHQKQLKSRRILKVKHKSHQDASDFNFSKSSRYDEESREPKQKKNHQSKQSIKPQELQMPQLNQSSKTKRKNLRIKPTPERLKLLKKKFKYCAWMVIFYKNKYYQIQENKAIKRFNDEATQFEEQFQIVNALTLFIKEGQKISLFKKSWVFTERKDVPIRINNLISAAAFFIKQLIITTQNIKFDQKHISYIKLFTTNGGYLFPTHSAFVTQRLKLDYKRKLKFTSVDQQKMVFLEHCFVQLLLYDYFFVIKNWQELLKPLTESLKIFVSLMQYLFIDKFKSLEIISKDMKFNIEEVYYLDFTKSNLNDIKQLIDINDPKFQVTDKSPILGLYDETVLKPVIDNPGFQNLQNQFTVFVDFIYSKVE